MKINGLLVVIKKKDHDIKYKRFKDLSYVFVICFFIGFDKFLMIF